MKANLERLYRPDMPFDEQSECIEFFFDHRHACWKELGFTGDGSDEESRAMIEYALANFELTGKVEEMLISWRDNGF